MSIFDWIAVIGVFAWFPCAYPIIMRRVTKSEVDIVTSKHVQIGFTTYGPIINLNLAFPVKNHDLIINDFEIILEHENGETKTFKWQGINQTVGTTRTLDGAFTAIEKDYPVLIMKLNQTDADARFIRCQDPLFLSETNELIRKVVNKIRLERDRPGFELVEIIKSKEILELKDCSMQSFNWKKGKYTITIRLKAPEKFKILNDSFCFSLSMFDVEQLTCNINEVMDKYDMDLINGFENNHEPKWKWLTLQLNKFD